MKSLLMGLALLAYATSAEAAEAWTCSPSGTPTSVLYRFTLSPPDVISTYWKDMRFRIVHNDDYELVATGDDPLTEGNVSAGINRLYVYTIAINKVTGAYGIALFEAAENGAPPDVITHGKCLKD
jgi:hypothetical protein